MKIVIGALTIVVLALALWVNNISTRFNHCEWYVHDQIKKDVIEAYCSDDWPFFRDEDWWATCQPEEEETK